MIAQASNAKLCDFGRRWRLDGDYLRCLGCARAEGRRPSPATCQVGRPMIASCDGEPFTHADGCKQAKELHPWAELRALIAEPARTDDTSLIAALEAEGVSFLRFEHAVIRGREVFTTSGSTDVEKLLAAMRRVMSPPAGRVLVPDAANMTDEQAEAIAQVANVCGGIAYDIYRAAIEAAPK